MPIKGLTGQPRAFVELGQLRKGAPKPKDGKKPGPDLTYFRPVFNEGEEEAARMFFEAYGGEPKAIEVFLPFDEPDANFETWKEAYLAGGLVHRCDGEHVIYAIEPDSGELLVQNGLSVETGEPVKCDGGPVAHYTDQKGNRQPLYCQPEGRLKVIILALRRLAYVTVITHSIWDIVNLSAQLEGYQWENRGKLRGIRFILSRRPKMISTPSGSGGKRARRKKWLLDIEPAPSWVEEQFLILEQAAKPRLIDKPLELPPGVPDTNGHDEAVEGEYEIQGNGKVWEDEQPVYETEELPFTDDSNGPDWDGQYPTTMAEVKERAEQEPYCFDNGDIRAAIEKRLTDEFGDPTPTPEDFKKEVGEKEAAAYFWEAVVMEYELRQAPEMEDEEFPY